MRFVFPCLFCFFCRFGLFAIARALLNLFFLTFFSPFIFPSSFPLSPTPQINRQPQGVNVQPILDSVMPMGANAQPQAVAVAPADVMRARIGVLNNPVSGSAYAPVGEHIAI